MKIFKIINKLNNQKPILAIILILICFVFCSCKKEDIISKNTMAQIISELYLADEYVNQTPEYRSQTDSLRLYPGIIKKYGYTMDDYEKSVKHYLEDKETYKELHIKAKQILQKREDELTIIQIGKDKYLQNQNKLSSWWVLDSLKSLSDKQTAKNQLLFVLKNINKTNSNLNKDLFRVTDTSYLSTETYPNIWNRLKFIDTTKFNMFKDVIIIGKKENTVEIKKEDTIDVKRVDTIDIKRKDTIDIKREDINNVKREYSNGINKETIKPKKNLDIIKKIDNN